MSITVQAKQQISNLSARTSNPGPPTLTVNVSDFHDGLHAGRTKVCLGRPYLATSTITTNSRTIQFNMISTRLYTIYTIYYDFTTILRLHT
jgi:hypothetical protein